MQCIPFAEEANELTATTIDPKRVPLSVLSFHTCSPHLLSRFDLL